MLLVRHGQSCANIISEYTGKWDALGKMTHKNYNDPLLSDCGLRRTRAAAKLLQDEEVDFIGSSPLMRAIETAWLQIRGDRDVPVYVLPHIAEQAHGLSGYMTKLGARANIITDGDNTPLDQDEQLEVLRRMHGETIASRVKYDLFHNVTLDESTVSSWPAFEEFVAGSILPSMPPKPTPITIAVASHSMFLQNAFGKHPAGSGGFAGWGESIPSARESLCWEAMPQKGATRTKPHNNQVLELFFDYDLESGSLALDFEAGCHALGAEGAAPGVEEIQETGAEGGHVDLPTFPEGVPGSPKTLCEEDFATRCLARTPRFAGVLTRDEARDVGADGPPAFYTAHERVRPANAWPWVSSEEQKWADAWRKAETQQRSAALQSQGVPGQGVSIGAGGYSPLPEFPDIPLVCDCRITV